MILKLLIIILVELQRAHLTCWRERQQAQRTPSTGHCDI